MTDQTEDWLFEDILALSNEAEHMGLTDVAVVLEFALDVFLKETGRTETKASSAPLLLERSARRFEKHTTATPKGIPRLGWSMSAFPLAQLDSKAS